MNNLDKYTTPLPPPFPILKYLENIRNLTEEHGVTSVAAKLFDMAKVAITITDEQQFDSDAGMLLVGDHRQGIECLPLLAVFGKLERKDVHFVAKPFSMQARIMGHLATSSSGLTLPVIPKTLARNRKNILNRDLFWRITKRDFLPSESEIKEINISTLDSASCFVQKGDAAVIYPAGGVVDACTVTWKRGVGEIIKSIEPDNRNSVKIIPFRFDDFSRWRLVRSLEKACKNKTSNRPQEITLRLGECGTVKELFPNIDTLTSTDITSQLHDQFIEQFGEVV